MWWANAVAIGAEMDGFFHGLRRAASVTSDSLDLKGKLGGDPPTVTRIVASFMHELKSLDVRDNEIGYNAAEQLTEAALSSIALGQLPDKCGALWCPVRTRIVFSRTVHDTFALLAGRSRLGTR